MSYRPEAMMSTTSYVVLPGTLLSMKLPPVELSVLIHMTKLAQQGATSPDSATLSTLVGVGRKEVVEAITRLEQRNLISPGKVIGVLPSNSAPPHNPPCVTPTHSPSAAAAVTPDSSSSSSSSSNSNSTPKGTPYSPPRKAPSRFSPPTLEEVKVHMMNCLLPKTEGKKFFDYYETVGWVVGRGKKMKCWKSAISTWKSNYLDNGGRLLSKGQAQAQVSKDSDRAPADWKGLLDAWLVREYPEPEQHQIDRVEEIKSGSWHDVPDWLQAEALA